MLSRARSPTFLALASYAALTIVFTWPVVLRLSKQVAGRAGDLRIALWDLWWLETAIGEGRSPFHTPYLFHPDGVSLAYHSVSWGFAAVALPLRALFGAVAGYNLAFLFQTFLCATTMYFLASYLVRHGLAAWLAGLMFAFEPFRMTRAMHHPNLATTAFVPLKRWLFVLVVLACAYVPPAFGLALSAKKGDRYVLLFFPLLTFAATCAAVALGRLPISRPRLRVRAAFVALGVASLVVGLRGARLARVHPLPITWCAGYPGFECESLITIGQGEGFRDAALWIAEHSPVRHPNVLSQYAGGAVMTPWLPFRRVRAAKDAHFVVTYIASEQRALDRGVQTQAVGEPLHEIRYENRTYVRIYPGPKYERAMRRKRSRSG